LAGKNMANPIALILSAAMMFEWLAERHDDKASDEAARCIEQAVEQVLASGRFMPADLGGTASTTDVADAVIAAI
jgi:3-isopropylmalate dehydrogenase